MSELREVMRRWPQGVAVLTVDADGERVGLTVSSVVSLSLEPPLVGVAISEQAAMHELLRRAGGFTLSLLAAGQDSLAKHFARGVPPIAMWEGVDLLPGDGAPRLADALGWVDARLAGEAAAGDHTLFLGEVVSAEAGIDAAPLVRVGGEYA